MYLCGMVVLKLCLRRKVVSSIDSKVISSIDSKNDCYLKFVYCLIPLPVWKDADTSVHHLVTTLLSALQNSCYNVIAFKDFLMHKTLKSALETSCGSRPL